jgi:DNA-binding LacI/PurR family transcriptional regulator
LATNLDPATAAENIKTTATTTRISAIWAYNGFLAAAGLEQLALSGQNYVPTVGDQFSGLTVLSQAQAFPLTQVRIPSTMGADAIRLALQILGGESVPQFIEIQIVVIAAADVADYDLTAPLLGDAEGLPPEFLEPLPPAADSESN